ncbi:MAG: hypothetical protein ACK4P2_10660 [Hyphomonas sp.]
MGFAAESTRGAGDRRRANVNGKFTSQLRQVYLDLLSWLWTGGTRAGHLEVRVHMDNLFYWFLTVPPLILLILYYLAFLAGGAGFLVAAFRSTCPGRRIAFSLVGLGILIAPFAADFGQKRAARHSAAERAQQLASLERTDLAGKLPRKLVTVGNYSEADISFIKTQYGMSQFPPEENERLSSAYRHYRSQEFCKRHSAGKMMSPEINIPVCKEIPGTVQEALGLREPVLVLAEGFSTSLRRSNTHLGDIYEIRLVTPEEDVLVDYFEEETLDDPASIINPYSSGQRLKPGQKILTRKEFIEAALEGASR